MGLLRGSELCACFGVGVFHCCWLSASLLSFGESQCCRERARGGGGNNSVVHYFRHPGPHIALFPCATLSQASSVLKRA